ncbi:SDR family oxidoreductase [Nesterenkonia sp. E16_7]|uniref:SDR family NAD(P)-dependent oxidoreductase n=1 Tax=unclassified Nesterenkonia TaxID=2629769 RepID=UPI001A92F529|nr:MULTISPECIES: SDR family NAD(P)-dependent oxidoreductase [unclassified Nesterenkonia]MBO0594577.1 SDR family oxidoreductase [Nesterenkonia sp. E16_10]MBO0599770.1 SDR family oxidoreductase [Nesterenkonia sp. E16_7]
MSRPYQIVADPNWRPLAGKVAVVTGASGAIGRAITIRLAVDGAKVIALARDSEKLRTLVAEVDALGGTAEWESVDLRDSRAIREIAERLGSIDILINNAGGSSRSRNANIWDQSTETIDDVLTVNLRAPMLTVAAFGRGLLDSGPGGRIINLGSTVGVGGLPKFSDYAAAKAGVAGYTRSAALEFGPHGVTVNCVTPGIIQRGQIGPSKVEKTLKKGVLPRLGRAEDVAEMVAFIAGPHAAWITGQEIVVDGGRSIGLHGEP